ncbi:4Fe-4S dicluster domain-containing protein [Bacteroidota bacterium]
MFYKKLKWIRVVVSLIFFTAILLLYIDIYDAIPTWFHSSAIYLQFFPSLVKFITHPLTIISGFIFILLLTFLFGRVYCSGICPLGVFMDIIARLAGKFKKRNKYQYKKPTHYLRYIILLITLVFLITDSMLFINLLDPYSIFGRIANNLLNPGAIYFNNLLTSIFESFDIYSFYYIDISPIAMTITLISLAYLLIIIVFAAFFGRQYCNLICPVGSFLSLISKYSVFKIEYDIEECTQCGACEKVCKSNCINSEDMHLDFSRCVSCFNCFTVCPTNGFHYESVIKSKSQKKEVVLEKREFIKTTAFAVAGLAGINSCSYRLTEAEAESMNISKNPVIPPGAFSIENFTKNCTACYLCVSACPTNVIKPALLDFGIYGIFQPKMDFKSGFCNYDCVKCTEICPSGAILLLSTEEKKLTQTGKAKFIKKDCIIETKKKECGACAEHCPTKAVHMIPYEKITIPEVDEKICIGCGACEFACPTIPRKAIYVESNIIHQKVKAPKVKKPEVIETDDFPF